MCDGNTKERATNFTYEDKGRLQRKGVFPQSLKGPVGVYQAEDRVKSVPDTKEANFPFFIVYLELKLSPILAKQEHRTIESKDPQVTVLQRQWKMVQSSGAGAKMMGVHILTPEMTSCVTLAIYLTFLGFHFLICEMGIVTTIYKN